ncbi:MAG: hypothetical protein ACK5M7_18015 [Draconibacterium sp.]
MKRLIFLGLLAVCFVACNTKVKKVSEIVSQAMESTENTVQGISEGDKVAEKLLKTTPLNGDELESAFPLKIRDLELNGKITVVAQQVMGQFGHRKELMLSVMDGAGNNSQAVAFFIARYKLPYEPGSDTNSFKLIKKERDGINTLTDYHINRGKCEVWFLYRNRYVVTVENNDNTAKMTPDELWAAFDVNALDKFK